MDKPKIDPLVANYRANIPAEEQERKRRAIQAAFRQWREERDQEQIEQEQAEREQAEQAPKGML